MIYYTTIIYCKKKSLLTQDCRSSQNLPICRFLTCKAGARRAKVGSRICDFCLCVSTLQKRDAHQLRCQCYFMVSNKTG